MFVVSLPIPNDSVLRIFLVGEYCTVFMPRHPIAWLLSLQPGLMSCAPQSSVLPSHFSSWGWIYHWEDVWDPNPQGFALLYQKWLSIKQGNCKHPTDTTKTNHFPKWAQYSLQALGWITTRFLEEKVKKKKTKNRCSLEKNRSILSLF